MSLYTTPLQIGYFMGLLFTVLFFWRGKKEERLTDLFMGALMLILTLEIQDYTFGFAGINFLWTTLNGFPRDASLLFGPAVYFYLLSQAHRDFTLKSKDLLHLLPFSIFFLLNLFVFLMGGHAVQSFQSSQFGEWVDVVGTLVRWGSYFYYFYKSFGLYGAYRLWLVEVHSDPDKHDLRWFRNFLIILAIGVTFTETMGLIDYYLDLSFYEDWWWNLWLVGVIILTGIRAYAQPQWIAIGRQPAPPDETEVSRETSGVEQDDKNLIAVMEKVDRVLKVEKSYLQPDLNLGLLSEAVKLPATEVSRAINKVKGMNFNDYVNSFRVEEFKRVAMKPENRKLTLLALAHDSGFNSKATFNRVFAKREGQSPGTWLRQQMAH